MDPIWRAEKEHVYSNTSDSQSFITRVLPWDACNGSWEFRLSKSSFSLSKSSFGHECTTGDGPLGIDSDLVMESTVILLWKLLVFICKRCRRL